VLLLNECLLLFISLSSQSGKFWIHPRIIVLYGCKIWSLTLRGERRLVLFGLEVLRTFVAERRSNGGGGGASFSSPNTIRVIKSMALR